MKKIFISSLIVGVIFSAFLTGKDKNSVETKNMYPDLEPLTGKYEYYSGNRYEKLKIIIKEGKLALVEIRAEPIILEYLSNGHPERINYKGVKKGNEFILSFVKNSEEKINRLEFIGKSVTIEIKRQPESYLKKKYLIQELKEDFNQFRNNIESSAVSLYEFTDKKTLDMLFNKKYNEITSPMTLREFYCLLLPLKEKIGCGHSHLDYPYEYRTKVQNYKFPLIITILGNKCYLKENLQRESCIPVYSEILNINEVGIIDIIKTLKNDISADGHNEQFKNAAFESCFQYYYANRYGVPENYRITFKKESSGDLINVTIPAVKCKSINYSNNEPGKLQFSILNKNKTALITVHSFSYYGEKNKIFFDFIDNSFKKIRGKDINSVILDIRRNAGGDPYCAAYLLSYIGKFPVRYFAEAYPRYEKLAEKIPLASNNNYSGDLFVLTDRNNFSTSGHFLSLLKYHEIGELIGSETGSTYACNGAVKGFELKNTRIYQKLSTRTYSAAVEGLKKGRGIMPEHIISTSIDDLRSGRDNIIEYCLNIIKSKKD